MDAMQEITRDWAAVEGAFEIGMIPARCRRLDGCLKSLCQMAPHSTSLQRIREVAPC